jgi:hypothetical protein
LKRRLQMSWFWEGCWKCWTVRNKFWGGK